MEQPPPISRTRPPVPSHAPPRPGRHPVATHPALPHAADHEKKSGMKKTPSERGAPAFRRTRPCRASGGSPRRRHSRSPAGATPRMKAKDVMRMGRKRSAPPGWRPPDGAPCARSTVANSTIRMAFLAASPTTVNSPTGSRRRSACRAARRRAAPQQAEGHAEQHRERAATSFRTARRAPGTPARGRGRSMSPAWPPPPAPGRTGRCRRSRARATANFVLDSASDCGEHLA